jgi:alkanesulfonate monooxygenase SsuD/methylene tetrahydromethanopterin reductase-like flavin-dependent oxidoreductase (luciferase family)
MKFGVQLPNLGPFSDVQTILELAHQAEDAGWDGFFLWDHVAIPEPMLDSMTALAAVAATTKRLMLGPMITAPARRRPWKLAREATTLDHLSNGRFILGVGLGGSDYDYFHCHEPVANDREKAAMLDEALAIIAGLWRGEVFSYSGQHYQIDELVFHPRPVQQPRIPIWVAGWWPIKAPMRRAARWDGAFPLQHEAPLSPTNWRDIGAFIANNRASTNHFDMVHSGITPNDPQAAGRVVQPYAEAGVTWWLEDISPVRVGWKLGDDWPQPWPIADIVERIKHGPPQI